jgi:menaquinone-dependent protoporphyrinogen IX oxidase
MGLKRVLVAYATNSGSTEEIANAIGGELGRFDAQVDIRRIDDNLTVEPYDAVVVGAPMILGWHRAACGFLKKHRAALQRVPTGCFLVAMSLTQTDDSALPRLPLALDPGLAKAPRQAGRLTLRERYTSVHSYLGPVLGSAGGMRPVSIGIFGGRMELFRLNWLQVLFVLLVIQAQPADLRNWPFIRAWAAHLAPLLLQDRPG